MRSPRAERGWLGVAVTFAVLAAGAASAQASTVVGANTTGTPGYGLNCAVSAAQPCQLTATVQRAAPAHQAAGGPTVPTAGVIVGWSLAHGRLEGPGGSSAVASYMTVNLRVIRGAGASGIGSGTGPTEQLPQASGTYSFPARLPVEAGDRIGYDLRFMPGDLVLYAGSRGSPGDAIGGSYSSIWPDGGTPTSYLDSNAPPFYDDVYLLMTATVEPDADGDGYGDETQDGCPTDASAQGSCPAPPDTEPPETKITKGPAARSKKSTAKFKFASSEPDSTFECSLKGKGLDKLIKQFGDCDSPRKYKRLGHGEFKFKVRATDAAGNVDPTPAKAKFKVTR